MTINTHTRPAGSLPWLVIRKTGVTIAGVVVMLAGVIMLVIPGPGIVTILAGLAILGTEFPWAKRLVQRVVALAKSIMVKVRNKVKKVKNNR